MGGERGGALAQVRRRAAAPGQWVRLVYSSGLLDPLIRPVLRIVGRHQIDDDLVAGGDVGPRDVVGRPPETSAKS